MYQLSRILEHIVMIPMNGKPGLAIGVDLAIARLQRLFPILLLNSLHNSSKALNIL